MVPDCAKFLDQENEEEEWQQTLVVRDICLLFSLYLRAEAYRMVREPHKLLTSYVSNSFQVNMMVVVVVEWNKNVLVLAL